MTPGRGLGTRTRVATECVGTWPGEHWLCCGSERGSGGETADPVVSMTLTVRSLPTRVGRIGWPPVRGNPGWERRAATPKPHHGAGAPGCTEVLADADWMIRVTGGAKIPLISLPAQPSVLVIDG